MSEAGGQKWGDLGVRVFSGLLLACVAGAALGMGEAAWTGLVLIACALMLWELAGLCEPGIDGTRRLIPALMPLITLAALLLFPQLGPWTGLLLFAALPVGALGLLKGWKTWLGYGLIILFGAVVLINLRALGWQPIAALVAVVVLSDIAGYFAGRMLGGPKFWPRFSPKKTWSGTIAGWLAAFAFGLWAGPQLFGLPALAGGATAALLALAGQMGDILESALKRRAGVKDASALIPGHGGFLDRFDALIVAAGVAGLFLIIAMMFSGGATA